MPTIPSFLIGKNVTTFTVSPTTVAAGGVVTVGSPSSLLGKFDELTLEVSNNLIDIHSADAAYSNNVITTRDFTVTLTEIIPATGSSILFGDWYDGDIFQSVCQATDPNGSVAGKTLTVLYVVQGVRYGISEGKNTAVLTGKACGVAPTWA